MIASPPTLPRGCAWTLLAAGALSAIIGIFSLAAIPTVWKRSQELWNKALGTVTEAVIKQGERRSNQHRHNASKSTKTYDEVPVYTVMLKYEYEAGGQRQSGGAPAPEQPENDEDRPQAASIVDTYPAGRTLPVFYRPEDPSQSRLTEKEAPREFIWDVVFGGVFALFGLGALLLGRLCLKR